MRIGPYLLGPNDTDENGIYTGDAVELAESIPDESIDLIFTDPPYPKEFLPLFGWLDDVGGRVLKPGGLLMAMSGHSYLPEIFAMMGKKLVYHWLFAIKVEGAKPTIWPRRISPGWKPVFSYSKGPYDGPWWGTDLAVSVGRDKRYHTWGQSETAVSWFLSRLPNGILFEPFCGGGSTLAVAKYLGFPYLSFELDPEMAETARERVRQTPLSLFTPEPTQMTLMGD